MRAVCLVSSQSAGDIGWNPGVISCPRKFLLGARFQRNSPTRSRSMPDTHTHLCTRRGGRTVEDRIGIDGKQTRARANLADVWRDVIVLG